MMESEINIPLTSSEYQQAIERLKEARKKSKAKRAHSGPPAIILNDTGDDEGVDVSDSVLISPSIAISPTSKTPLSEKKKKTLSKKDEPGHLSRHSSEIHSDSSETRRRRSKDKESELDQEESFEKEGEKKKEKDDKKLKSKEKSQTSPDMGLSTRKIVKSQSKEIENEKEKESSSKKKEKKSKIRNGSEGSEENEEAEGEGEGEEHQIGKDHHTGMSDDAEILKEIERRKQRTNSELYEPSKIKRHQKPIVFTAKAISPYTQRRRKSLPTFTRRRTSSLENSPSRIKEPDTRNQKRRSTSLTYLGDDEGLCDEKFSSSETREDKMNKLCQLLVQADRSILAHFLDEARGDVELALDLYLQKSLFTESSDGTIRRQHSEEEAEGSSQGKKSRLQRIFTGLSPTKTWKYFFEREDKDKEKHANDELSSRPRDTNIEDLLKLLDQGNEKIHGPDNNLNEIRTKNVPQTRARHNAWLLDPHPYSESKTRSPTSHMRRSLETLTLHERKFDCDTSPTHDLEKATIFHPDRKKFHYSSELNVNSDIDLNYNPPTISILKDYFQKLYCSEDLTKYYSSKRFFYIMELMTTEYVYIQVLQIIANVFIKPLYYSLLLKNPLISLYEIQAIFSTLIDIPQYHLIFEYHLQKRLLDWDDSTLVGDLINDHVNRLTPYKDFASNSSASRNMELKCILQNRNFEQYLEDLFTDPQCNNTSLREFLDYPLQRIPRYKMLIKDILAETDIFHGDYQKIAAAYNKIKILDEQIHIIKNKQESIKKLAHTLQNISDCPPVIISPSRIVIDEIIAQEASSGLNKKIVKFVLFQDSLLMASRIIPTKKSALPNSKSNLEDGFRFDMLIRHDNLFIMENQGLHETFFHLWLVDAAYIFQAPSLEDKMRWLQNLRNTISFIALQKDTQTKLNRHLTLSNRSRSLSFRKKRSVSLNSTQARMNIFHLTESKANLSKDDRFEYILRDPIGLSKFTAFLQSEFSDENIEFWLECERFKIVDDEQFLIRAKQIFAKYIVPGAPKEVNLKHKSKEGLVEKLEKIERQEIQEYDKNLFSEAQLDIYELMFTDSFPRFLKSDYYVEYTQS